MLNSKVGGGGGCSFPILKEGNGFGLVSKEGGRGGSSPGGGRDLCLRFVRVLAF